MNVKSDIVLCSRVKERRKLAIARGGMSYPKDEMTPPPAAIDDAKSFEIARLWVANDAQHVVLRTDVWPDPAAWGIVLADLARHVALAYQRTGDHDVDVEDVLERVLAGFQAELESPTDSPDGGIHDE
jgi:hypothetical protein